MDGQVFRTGEAQKSARPFSNRLDLSITYKESLWFCESEYMSLTWQIFKFVVVTYITRFRSLRLFKSSFCCCILYLLINDTTSSFEKYSVRTGHSFWNLRFFMDGERIKRKVTPKSLELEQNDIIEVFIDQTGGNGNTGPAGES